MMQFNEKAKSEETPSEALMKALEAFGEAEPQGVLILWVDKEFVNFIRNGINHTEAIGLLEFAKARVMQRLTRE